MDFKRLERMCYVFPDLERALEDLLEKDDPESGFWMRPDDDWINCDELDQAVHEIFYPDGSDEARIVDDIERKIGYHFIDEKLLIQALTRRSASLDKNSETLEFLGDRALDYVVTKNLDCIFGSHNNEVYRDKNAGFYKNEFSEGEMTRIKSRFVSTEYLAEAADRLGIGEYIIFGKSDLNNNMQNSSNAKEDAVEAIIGAVAVDTDWDYNELENVIDHILDLQKLKDDKGEPDVYDRLQTWTQKHNDAELDVHVVMREREHFTCFMSMRGIDYVYTAERDGKTRNAARLKAAEMIYTQLAYGGKLYDVSNSGIVPDLNDAINQVQELYQKGYIDKTQYDFKKIDTVWYCYATCGALLANGQGRTKTEAKKAAAYEILKKLKCAYIEDRS